MSSKPTKHRSKWRIRWLDADGHRQSKSFNTYRDAERALAIYKAEADQIREGLKARPAPTRTFCERKKKRKASSNSTTRLFTPACGPVNSSACSGPPSTSSTASLPFAEATPLRRRPTKPGTCQFSMCSSQSSAQGNSAVHQRPGSSLPRSAPCSSPPHAYFKRLSSGSVRNPGSLTTSGFTTFLRQPLDDGWW